jgi:hypothetical protein
VSEVELRELLAGLDRIEAALYRISQAEKAAAGLVDELLATARDAPATVTREQLAPVLAAIEQAQAAETDLALIAAEVLGDDDEGEGEGHR